jgi:hypothetical protein
MYIDPFYKNLKKKLLYLHYLYTVTMVDVILQLNSPGCDPVHDAGNMECIDNLTECFGEGVVEYFNLLYTETVRQSDIVYSNMAAYATGTLHVTTSDIAHLPLEVYLEYNTQFTEWEVEWTIAYTPGHVNLTDAIIAALNVTFNLETTGSVVFSDSDEKMDPVKDEQHVPVAEAVESATIV